MSVGEVCPKIGGLTIVKGKPVTIGGIDEPDRRKVLVVEFWATWCPPCRDSIPHLTSLQQQYASKDVYIIGITDEDVKKVEPFVQSMGAKMDYTVAVDTALEARRGLYSRSGAQGIPHSFIIDHNNKITYSGHPMDPGFDTALRAAAVHATERVQKKALPLITDTFEELMTCSVRELKGMLQERRIDHTDCVEKADLARKVVDRCSKVAYYT